MRMPTQDDIQRLSKWLNSKEIPSETENSLRALLLAHEALLKGSLKSKQTLMRLREAMGIMPKSERGRSISPVQPELSYEEMSPEAKKEYEELIKKRSELLREKAGYDRKLKKLKPRPKNPEQLEFDLADPNEMMFSHPVGERESGGKQEKVERMQEFGKEKGLHTASDKTKRMNLSVNVTEITYDVETVTDPETGKSVRASMKHVGPEGFQLTWEAIATLIKMHVGFAVPINRMALMIGQPEFSSSKICRVLRYIATNLLPIYLYLFEELSDAKIISGDDTKSKVLEVSHKSHSQSDKGESLSGSVEEHLGWTWPKANGKGDKKALNVTLLMGRSHEMDPRSTIRFFRTHLGSVGNLMSRALEWRQPKSGSLIFQGDLSRANLPHCTVSNSSRKRDMERASGTNSKVQFTGVASISNLVRATIT